MGCALVEFIRGENDRAAWIAAVRGASLAVGADIIRKGRCSQLGVLSRRIDPCDTILCTMAEGARSPADDAAAKSTSSPAAPKGPWIERIRRFLRSSLVGIVATAIDFLVLEIVMRGLGTTATVAKIFSLAAGTATQFIGSRYYAFRSRDGLLARQLRWFLFVEFCAYWVTVFVFHGIVRWLHVPAEIANLASGSIVYFGLSYPLWHRVFQLRGDEEARARIRRATLESTKRSAPAAIE